ncbi:MAG: UDP-N-acetylmuramoyl-L-alanine--D-glutamate ligase [Chitinophagaceae bacterium]|nr:MAG: UDP-N-acetylmuramoyl-L-alanine--D-glutamate ligase [Chitinophagaceae bacterium]
MEEHKNHIVILGAGESGVGAAILAKQKGHGVFVSDNGTISEAYKKELTDRKIPFEEKHHTTEYILKADEIVKSPGISEKAEIMKNIRRAGIPVISEIELAYRYAHHSKIIAITGSNGKSTTTALTYHIFHQAGLNAACVGNIGKSFARRVAESPADYYIVEVSSFQLDDINEFRPDVAVLLNITADHLDRYEYKMENYAKAKFRIIENQTEEDYFVYCKDDPETQKYFNRQPINSQTLPFTIMETLHEGAFMEGENMHIRIDEDDMSLSIYELALKGKHNWYNSMAAGISARVMQIRKGSIRESMKTFTGLAHRLEFVATVRGVDFINDSKATNVNSVWFALETMVRPAILILGGVDKGNDYSLIRELVKEKVKAIVCLGTDNHFIHEAFKKDVPTMVNTSNMKDAVQTAYMFSEPGDVVLLSPACASFDLFKNYEDRGNQFKEQVRDL